MYTADICAQSIVVKMPSSSLHTSRTGMTMTSVISNFFRKFRAKKKKDKTARCGTSLDAGDGDFAPSLENVGATTSVDHFESNTTNITQTKGNSVSNTRVFKAKKIPTTYNAMIKSRIGVPAPINPYCVPITRKSAIQPVAKRDISCGSSLINSSQLEVLQSDAQNFSSGAFSAPALTEPLEYVCPLEEADLQYLKASSTVDRHAEHECFNSLKRLLCGSRSKVSGPLMSDLTQFFSTFQMIATQITLVAENVCDIYRASILLHRKCLELSRPLHHPRTPGLRAAQSRRSNRIRRESFLAKNSSDYNKDYQYTKLSLDTEIQRLFLFLMSVQNHRKKAWKLEERVFVAVQERRKRSKTAQTSAEVFLGFQLLSNRCQEICTRLTRVLEDCAYILEAAQAVICK